MTLFFLYIYDSLFSAPEYISSSNLSCIILDFLYDKLIVSFFLFIFGVIYLYFIELIKFPQLILLAIFSIEKGLLKISPGVNNFTLLIKYLDLISS